MLLRRQGLSFICQHLECSDDSRPGLGRVDYVSVTDDEALAAFTLCSRLEGILPALEPSHALAHVARIAPDLPADNLLVMNMCGRGDKDVFTVAEALGVSL